MKFYYSNPVDRRLATIHYRKIQRGLCAICLIDIGMDKRDGECIDHDHNTDLIRGLLCKRCNFVLGWAKDDSTILRMAAEYLEKTHKKEDYALAKQYKGWL